jgi:hypothetical protein
MQSEPFTIESTCLDLTPSTEPIPFGIFISPFAASFVLEHSRSFRRLTPKLIIFAFLSIIDFGSSRQMKPKITLTFGLFFTFGFVHLLESRFATDSRRDLFKIERFSLSLSLSIFSPPYPPRTQVRLDCVDGN